MQVTIDLSSPCHSLYPTSKALHDLWYSRARGENLLDLINAYGCPHTGGEHSFHFTAERTDALAWLELFEETYPDCTAEVAIIKRKIRSGVIRGEDVDSRGNLKVVLKKIMREVGFKGEIVSRPWFWNPDWETEEES